jgi:hypothetical protein
MSHQVAVIARNPHLDDDDENALETVFYDGNMEVGDVTRSLYHHDGLEFQLKSTVDEHHGEEFTEKYGDALVNDSRVQEMTLAELAGNFLVFFCESEYPELDD